MERRVLLAIFLSFLVVFVYQTLVVKPVPKPPASSRPPVPADTSAVSPPTSAAATPPEPAGPPPERAAALLTETDERDISIETGQVLAVFTNRGGRLKSWRLKHYRNSHGQPEELIIRGLSPTATADTQALPFTVKVPERSLTETLNQALYKVTQDAASPTDVRFEYRDSAGLRVTKHFQLDPSSYLITCRVSIMQDDRAVAPTVVWGPAVGDTTVTSQYSQKPSGLLFENGKARRLAHKDIASQPEHQGDFAFAGVDDNYFMTVALGLTAAKVSFQPVSIPPAQGSQEPPRELVAYAITPPGSDQGLRFFVGPKDFSVLSAIGRDLPNAIDFGIFKVIVVPLLQSLKWVNSFVGNYGWSIVILTIVINAIMFPLRHKSTVSMRKMQELQPQVKAIQDRYAKLKATDPAKQKMNQELMALYRERGVNPASGCVPILLTMPVLLAMWALLQTSIELRGAPWFGWIHDLSAHDPYYVLAVLMGVTGFWQQKMMPATGADPAQQKMMMFMPLMMTVMLAWLPAGALIYYVVTNLWMIGQQYLTNYLIGPPVIRTVRPPAERRLKRASSGGKADAAARDAE